MKFLKMIVLKIRMAFIIMKSKMKTQNNTPMNMINKNIIMMVELKNNVFLKKFS